MTPLLTRASRAELIAEVVTEAAGEEDLSLILAAALEHLRGLVPFTGGSIALVEGDRLVVRAAVGPFADLALEQRIPRNGSPSWAVIETRRPGRLPDVREAGLRVHRARRGSEIRSWMAAPLMRKGNAIGLLEVDSTEPHAFDDQHLELLVAVAVALGGPVEIARRYETESRALGESEAAQARLAFLAEAGEILSGSLDVDTTLASIGRLAVRGIADWCAIDLLDDEGEPRLVNVSHRDQAKARWAASVRERLPVDLEADLGVGRVLRTGQPTLVRDISEATLREALADDPARLAILAELGPLRSSMTVPMHEGERVIGAITFVSTESGRRYDQQDLRLAEDLARRASQFVSRARLFREASAARFEAERAADRTSQLLTITTELSTAVTQEEVAHAVVQRGIAALGARYGLLALISADGSHLEMLASSGLRGETVQRYARMSLASRTPLTDAARTALPQWLSPIAGVSDRYPDVEEGLEEAVRGGRRALAAVPLLASGRSIGAFALGFDEPHDLEDADGEFLVSLAQQCAQALERARLFEAERDARERAETIQGSLRSRERQQAAVAALGQQALGGASIKELFHASVEAVGRTLDADFVELLELEPDGRHMRLVAGVGWRNGLVGRARVDAGADSQGGFTLLSRGPVLAEDLTHESRFKPSRLLREHSAASGITVPVGRPPAFWGVLGAMTGHPRSFTADDVNFVLAIANVLAALIERDRVQQERDRLLEVEREAQRRRQAFIGVMSHELRTPITTIYAGAKFLARGGRGAARRKIHDEVVADLQAESERLYRLVEDLLVITRVERGQVEPAGEPLLLQRLLPRAAAAGETATSGLTIELDVPADLPTVRGEETYVEQVIRNYLSNARKYMPRGRVLITARGTDTEVEVRVLDEGTGFPPQEGERLFDLFYRSPTTAGHASGAGIGLFVCRQLVEAMGGRVWAKPRPTGGAEFGFSLQRVPDEEMD